MSTRMPITQPVDFPGYQPLGDNPTYIPTPQIQDTHVDFSQVAGQLESVAGTMLQVKEKQEQEAEKVKREAEKTKREAEQEQDKKDRRSSLMRTAELQKLFDDNQKEFDEKFNISNYSSYTSENNKRRTASFNLYMQNNRDFMSQNEIDYVTDNFIKMNTSNYSQDIEYQSRLAGISATNDLQKFTTELNNNTLRNPGNYWKNLDLLNNYTDTFEGTQDPVVIDKLSTASKEALANSMITGKINAYLENPRMYPNILQELKNGVYDKILSTDVINSSIQKLVTEDRQRKAQKVSELNQLLDDNASSIMNDGVGISNLGNEVKATGDPELIDNYERTTNTAKIINHLFNGDPTLPYNEELKLLEVLKPKPGLENYAEELATYEGAIAQRKKEYEKYEEDPVLYAGIKHQVVRDAFKESDSAGYIAVYEFQKIKNEGQPPWKIKLLTNQGSAKVSEEISHKIETGDYNGAKDSFLGFRNQFKDISFKEGINAWTLVAKQLSEETDNKIPQEFLEAMRYVETSHFKDIFSAIQVKNKDYKNLLPEKDMEGFNIEIDDTFKEYASASKANRTRLSIEKDMLFRLAAHYVLSGKDSKKAVEDAFNALFDYEIGKSKTNTFLVPKGINVDHVEKAIVMFDSDYFYNLFSKNITDKNELDRIRAFSQTLANKAIWRTNADKSGLTLYGTKVENGVTVEYAVHGGPLGKKKFTFTWDEFERNYILLFEATKEKRFKKHYRLF